MCESYLKCYKTVGDAYLGDGGFGLRTRNLLHKLTKTRSTVAIFRTEKKRSVLWRFSVGVVNGRNDTRNMSIDVTADLVPLLDPGRGQGLEPLPDVDQGFSLFLHVSSTFLISYANIIFLL